MTTFKTGNPIGSTAVKDLYDNAENLDMLTNDRTKRSHPDRLGVARKTWHGMEEDFQEFLLNSGYQSLGNYGSGIEITARNQFVWKDGEVYRPAAVMALPYTTTGDWLTEESLFVAMGDRILRQQLADAATLGSGADMVGYQTPTPEGVPQNLKAKINRMEITPYDFGAVGDGVADDTAAMKAFASAAQKNKYIPSGHYKVFDEIKFNPGDRVYGDGDASFIDASNITSFSSRAVVSAIGAVERLPNLTANVNFQTNTLRFSSDAGLEMGDVVLIFNPEEYSWSAWRAYYHAGEWCRVAAIENGGKDITVFGLTYDAYAAGDVEVYKLVGESTSFSNFRIAQPATDCAGLLMEFIDSPAVVDVRTGGSTDSGIYISKCVDIRVETTRALQSSSAMSGQYGLVVGNSQGGTVSGVYYGTRHSVALGGAGGVGAVSTRGLMITAPLMQGLGPTGAQDLHGNTEDITFMGGTFSHGGTLSGRNNRFFGCRFIGKDNSGIALYGGEIVGGTHQFTGCSFETRLDPNATGYGIINLQRLSDKLRDHVRIVFSDCIIRCPVGTTYPVRVQMEGTNVRVSVIFNGLTFTEAPSVNHVIRLIGFPGAAGKFEIIQLREVSGLPSSDVDFVKELSSPDVVRYQLPSQSGAVQLELEPGVSEVVRSFSFPYRYPRLPSIIIGSVAISAAGKRLVAGYSNGSGSGFTARVGSTDSGNFSGSAVVAIEYTATLTH